MSTYTLALPTDGPTIAQVVKNLPVVYGWLLNGHLVATRTATQNLPIAPNTQLIFVGNNTPNHKASYKGGDDAEAVEGLIATLSHNRMPAKVVFRGAGPGFALGTPAVKIALGIASEYVRQGYVGFIALYDSTKEDTSPLFQIRIPEGSKPPSLIVQKATTDNGVPELIRPLAERFALKKLGRVTT